MNVSAQKVVANTLNAAKSTGPRTEEGKKVCSRNATTFGMFVSDVCLEQEDEAEIGQLLAEYTGMYKPVNVAERELVHDITLAAMRKRRLARIEVGLFAAEQRAQTRHEASEQMTAAFVIKESTYNSLFRAQAAAERSYKRAYDALEKIRDRKGWVFREAPEIVQIEKVDKHAPRPPEPVAIKVTSLQNEAKPQSATPAPQPKIV